MPIVILRTIDDRVRAIFGIDAADYSAAGRL